MIEHRSTASRMNGGFLFVELLFVIGMLAVASLLGAIIFRTAGQALTETTKLQTSELQIDQALGRLRADVWGASAMESKNGQLLLVRSPGANDVHWKANGTLARTGPRASTLRWDRIDARIAFQVHGPTLKVRVERGPNDISDVVLISQFLLLQGGGQ